MRSQAPGRRGHETGRRLLAAGLVSTEDPLVERVNYLLSTGVALPRQEMVDRLTAVTMPPSSRVA